MSEKLQMNEPRPVEHGAHESQENKEVIPDRRREIQQALWEKGIEDPEARKVFDVWSLEREQSVEKEGPAAKIGVDIEIAEVLFDGGCEFNIVLDRLFNALQLSVQENLPELEGEVRAAIKYVMEYEEK